MGQPIPRIHQTDPDPPRRVAGRSLLLERVALGLAHEGKNPLHNLALHLQLLLEKQSHPAWQGGSPVEKHLTALREGIARVDHLLKAFGEFASPEHLAPDLGAAVQRALLLFAYDARRAGAQIASTGPESLLVRSDQPHLGDLVAHALVACIESARDGGRIGLRLEGRDADVFLRLEATGGSASTDHALAHLDEARGLAAAASCDLSIERPPAGGARLSLSFLHPR
jgi:C4-dicarboxylate-specific signal transduction histidine kinase